MKKILLILSVVFLLGIDCAKAQQDPMYSQYVVNGLALNPAYAGSRDAMSWVLLLRRQWFGVPGAPVTESFTFHMPDAKKRNGFGLSVVNDNITYHGRTWINLNYAYKIPVSEKTSLSLGIVGSVYNYRINWEKAVFESGGDVVPGLMGTGIWLPNVGTGAWFQSKNWYAGISVPRIMVNSLDNLTDQFGKDGENIGALVRHYFLTGGAVIPLSKDLKLKPSTLVKYTYAAPLEFDLNLTFFIKDRLGLTGSYRTKDGMVAMIQAFITPQLWLGYAYDYPFTKLANGTTGSHEIAIGFDLGTKLTPVISPRYY